MKSTRNDIHIDLEPENGIDDGIVCDLKLKIWNNMSTTEHKKLAPNNVTLGIITVSTTRVLADDKSGHWISESAHREGHDVVYHRVIPDDAEVIAATLRSVIRDNNPQVILVTGGTGITRKDVTIEAVTPLLEKVLSAFGPLFAALSFKEIGSAAFLSRATAGTIKKTVVFCIPGSLNACKLACRELIFPELGHLVKHVLD
jgi:molybdenum cofactor biosynthesis protein B